MKVTPLDLRQSQFATSLRGYDKNEVRALLADGADEFENALRRSIACGRSCSAESP
jgi:DivIVA domain-containing protein